MDLASSVQDAYEDIFFTILNEANSNGTIFKSIT